MVDRRSVRETFERIGPHFATTREFAWPEVEAFLEETGSTDLATIDGRTVGLDLGCGNCRHAEVLATHVDHVVGIDVSRSLLTAGRARAASRGFADELFTVLGDASALPLADESVDVAVYVATLHHLPRRAVRLRSLNELARVLSPDGVGLVSTWSTAHERFDDYDGNAETGFDTTIEWTLPGGETVDRFYHIYSPAEFERDLAASALDVGSTVVSSGNCYSRVGGSNGAGPDLGEDGFSASD